MSRGTGPGSLEQRPAETGGLTEKEFQALHELRQDAAPAPRGQWVEVDGTRAYLSLPEGARTPLPGVLVIHEWWGLNEHILHWADRLAAQGYAALAVDLYGGEVATTPEQAMAAMKKVDPERTLGILRAAHAFLVTDRRVQATHTGIIGWCFGGGQALRGGIALPELDAVVVYYGQPVLDVQVLKSIQGPVLALFGTKDESIPLEKVRQFDEALSDAGVAHRIITYDARHAFANPSGARYDAEAAAAAWEQTRAFLAEHLKQE
ncbi:MAG TPA: dienelactone hydrolase family protein [Myxococcaceae bacterium]|nr:dienelactone hydrolase family protein [Myxococcaceae bacterium]